MLLQRSLSQHEHRAGSLLFGPALCLYIQNAKKPFPPEKGNSTCLRPMVQLCTEGRWKAAVPKLAMQHTMCVGTQECPKNAHVLTRHGLYWEGCVSMYNALQEGAVQIVHSVPREESPLLQGSCRHPVCLSFSGAGLYLTPWGLPDLCVLRSRLQLILLCSSCFFCLKE